MPPILVLKIMTADGRSISDSRKCPSCPTAKWLSWWFISWPVWMSSVQHIRNWIKTRVMKWILMGWRFLRDRYIVLRSWVMLIRALPHMLSKIMFQHYGNPMLGTAGMLVVLHWEFPLSNDLLSCHSNNRCKRRNCTNGLLIEVLQMLKFSLKCNYWSSHPAGECQWCKWGYFG